MKELLGKRKAHLFFVGVFLVVVAFNIIIGFTAGQTILIATWNGISAIKPMDYFMLALFWYACAASRPEDEWKSSLISLNLSRTHIEK